MLTVSGGAVLTGKGTCALKVGMMLVRVRIGNQQRSRGLTIDSGANTCLEYLNRKGTGALIRYSGVMVGLLGRLGCRGGCLWMVIGTLGSPVGLLCAANVINIAICYGHT